MRYLFCCCRAPGCLIVFVWTEARFESGSGSPPPSNSKYRQYICSTVHSNAAQKLPQQRLKNIYHGIQVVSNCRADAAYCIPRRGAPKRGWFVAVDEVVTYALLMFTCVPSCGGHERSCFVGASRQGDETSECEHERVEGRALSLHAPGWANLMCCLVNIRENTKYLARSIRPRRSIQCIYEEDSII